MKLFKVWVCLGFLVVGGGGAVVGSPGGWTADLNCCALGFEVEELVFETGFLFSLGYS